MRWCGWCWPNSCIAPIRFSVDIRITATETAHMSPVLRLASASPRRQELLAQIGVPHAIAVPDVDEGVRRGEAVTAYVERVARAKAEAVWHRPAGSAGAGSGHHRGLDGTSLGKPRDRAHGLAMLERSPAASIGAHGRGARDRRGHACITSASTVRMRASSPRNAAVTGTAGEPRDKAAPTPFRAWVRIHRSLAGSYSG